ncbi:MAG: hypothetical protein ACRBB6_01345 [Neptuniibacter sp.]
MTSSKSQTRYIQICPAGAFYATVGSEPDDARAMLLLLLSSEVALPYSPQLVKKLTGLDEYDAEELFRKLEAKNFIELVEEPHELVTGAVESLLPELLSGLSNIGKVALADHHGFCLGSVGYDNDTAEELCALAADISSLHERHSLLLNERLGMMGESWGLLDPVGLSQVGFWVINLGHQRFILVINEMPKLNQKNYVDLINILARRYLDY